MGRMGELYLVSPLCFTEIGPHLSINVNLLHLRHAREREKERKREREKERKREREKERKREREKERKREREKERKREETK